MKKVAFFAMLLMHSAWHVAAQYHVNENLNWVFGSNAGVSFASGTPVSYSSSILADEGCSSVSDAAGNLLFYTNGKKVWNRLHTAMPSGESITPYSTMSRTQGALIVLKPADPGRYYVFSLGEAGVSGPDNHLTWVVVDMSLDGGLGDVDSSAGIANELPGFPFTEKLATFRTADCNVWMVGRSQDGITFYTFKISPTGISAPVVSPCGMALFSYPYIAYIGGVCKIAHNGSMIVAQSHSTMLQGWTELFRFDTSSGLITSVGVLDSTGYNYGAEFSPDNTKLYTWRIDYPSPPITSYRQICQYDVTLPTVDAIRASRVIVATVASGGRRDLKLAPDGKIYVSSFGLNKLDCIPMPDVAGTSCGYITDAVDLGAGICKSGLPNTVTAPMQETTTSSEHIVGCGNGSGVILRAPNFGLSPHYTWTDGSVGDTLNVTVSGTYIVYVQDNCDLLIDTFHVIAATLPDIYLGEDTTIYTGDTIVLHSSSPPGSFHIWSTGSIGDSISVSEAGTYWVTVSTEFCRVSDTITIGKIAGVSVYNNGITKAVFPNPAGNEIFITAAGLKGNVATIMCNNIWGREVLQQRVPINKGIIDAKINTEKLPAGIYEIRLEDGSGNYITGRVVIQR